MRESGRMADGIKEKKNIAVCRFNRDGMPHVGEYRMLPDDTGICKLIELDGKEIELVVHIHVDGMWSRIPSWGSLPYIDK